jgi:hypothetical protein
MVGEILMGFDESTLAYDLQRAHSADIWFLKWRYFIWSSIACVLSFMVGHLISRFGIDLYANAWEGFWNFYYGF